MSASARKLKNSKKKTKTTEKKTGFGISVKVIIFIIVVTSIPVLFYNPDLSFGPLDVFRHDFFKTEIKMSGIPYNTKGLVKAIDENNEKIVKLFVRSGFDLTSYSDSGVSPLCIAAESGNLGVVNIMMKGDVNLVQKNLSNGLTPAFCAVKGNNIQVLEKFLSSGIGIHSGRATKDGFSLLHYAAALGYDNMVSYLIDGGVEVNVKDVHGQTPLHIAVSQDNIVVLYMLLNGGANVNVEDNDGDTALDIAERNNKDVYVSLLNRYIKK